MPYEVARPMLFNGSWRQPGEPFDPSECHNLRVLEARRFIKKVSNNNAPPPSTSDTGEGDATGTVVSIPEVPVVAPEPQVPAVVEEEASVEQSVDTALNLVPPIEEPQVEGEAKVQEPQLAPVVPCKTALATPLKGVSPTPKTSTRPFTANLPRPSKG